MNLSQNFFTNNNEVYIQDSWDPLRLVGVLIGLLGVLLSLFILIIEIFHYHLYNFVDPSAPSNAEIIFILISAFLCGFLVYLIEIVFVYCNKKIWQQFQESSYEMAYGQLLQYGSGISISLFMLYAVCVDPWFLGVGNIQPILYIGFFDSKIFLLGTTCYVAIHSSVLASMGTFRNRKSVFIRDKENFSLTIKNETIIFPFILKSNRYLVAHSDTKVTLAVFQKISGSKAKHISYHAFIEEKDLATLFVLVAFDPIVHYHFPFMPIYAGNKTKLLTLLDQVKNLGTIAFHNPVA